MSCVYENINDVGRSERVQAEMAKLTNKEMRFTFNDEDINDIVSYTFTPNIDLVTIGVDEVELTSTGEDGIELTRMDHPFVIVDIGDRAKEVKLRIKKNIERRKVKARLLGKY